MPERVLVTGVAGFAGSHLAEALLRHGAEVHGIARSNGPHPNLTAIERDLTIHRADLRDSEATVRAIAAARPRIVYHLAARAVPAASWEDPRGTIETNVVGTVSLLEALRTMTTDPLVVLASTAEVYADAAERDLPLREAHPLGPRTPYAASKVAQEMLLHAYASGGGIRWIVLRCVNQVGPRLDPALVASAFAQQVAQAEAAGPRAVRVGNLAPRRDFVDVRDVARAYILAAERARPGRAYNVGTGTAVAIRTILDLLLAEARVPIEVVEDPARKQRADRPAMALDASAFREATSWTPTVPLAESLRDTLNHWRQTVRTTAARRAT